MSDATSPFSLPIAPGDHIPSFLKAQTATIFLMVLFLLSSAMTILRLPGLPIGSSELFFGAWILLIAHQGYLWPLNRLLVAMWGAFFVALGIGYAVFLPEAAMARHNAGAFIYDMLVCLALEAYMRKAPSAAVEKAIQALVAFGLSIYFLCALVFVSGWDYGIRVLSISNVIPQRMSGWSNNPDQLALFFTALPFLLLWLAMRRGSLSGRAIAALTAILFTTFVVGLSIRSDALLLAWAVSMSFMTVLSFVPGVKLDRKIAGLAFATFLSAWVFFQALPSLVTAAHDFQAAVVSSSSSASDAPSLPPALVPHGKASLLAVGFHENKAEVRLTLWMNGIKAWLESPLVGKGPGPHSHLPTYDFAMEAHNVPIDLLSQVGLLGTVPLAVAAFFLLGGAFVRRDPYALSILCVVGVYSLAHFTFRMPIFWFYLMLALWMTRARLEPVK